MLAPSPRVNRQKTQKPNTKPNPNLQSHTPNSQHNPPTNKQTNPAANNTQNKELKTILQTQPPKIVKGTTLVVIFSE